jgi:hypothetical protein
MRPIVLPLLSIGAAHAEPSIAERIATATYVPSPSALQSIPSVEWCAVVDAALANPNTNQTRREEYIATGQTMKCPHQMFLPPRKVVEQPLTPEKWCAEAFKELGNPRVDLKAALLEKARNRRMPTVEAKCPECGLR